MEQRINEMVTKSKRLNEVLENQHKIFNEFINANSDQKLISLKNLGMSKKIKSKSHKKALNNDNLSQKQKVRKVDLSTESRHSIKKRNSMVKKSFQIKSSNKKIKSQSRKKALPKINKPSKPSWKKKSQQKENILEREENNQGSL